jgi:hypothetical protein
MKPHFLLITLLGALGCHGTVHPGDDAQDQDAGHDFRSQDDAGHDGGTPEDTDAGSQDAGMPVDPYQVCSESGWCLDQPYPSVEALRAAVSLSADHALLAGDHGRLFLYDGHGLIPQASGTESDLFALFASSASDAWAAGAASTFVHFDGNTWSSYALPADAGASSDDELHGLWGASADDIWAVGKLGALWHFDGKDWNKQTSVTGKDLTSIWGASATQIMAVGDGGTLLTYDGHVWTPSQLPGGGSGLAIAGSAASNIWITGAQGQAWHYDGAAWTKLAAPVSDQTLAALSVVSPSEAYAAGDKGTALRFDGSSWHVLPSGTDADLHAVAGARAQLLLAGSAGTIVSFAEGARSLLSRGARGNQLDLASAATRTWIVGDGSLATSDQGLLPVKSDNARALYGCFALSDTFGWAVGTAGTIVRWDGSQEQTMDSGTTRWLHAVWASSESSAWVVGEAGTMLGLFNGSLWVQSQVPSNQTLYDVWGAAADDVWAAGESGTLLHWNGKAWSQHTSPTMTGLHSISGSAANHAFAVGASGTILAWDGMDWQTQQEGDSYTLYGVWTGADEAYAVGSGGTILRFSAGKWSVESAPVSTSLFAVDKDGAGTVRAVGANGVVLHRR